MSVPSPRLSALIAHGAPLIPVLHVEKADHAEPLVEALVQSGIVAFEVTLRTAKALEVIERMAKVGGNAVIGAGTVTRPEQFTHAKNAGARFAVSPALTSDLAHAAHASGLACVPGVATPSEALRAREHGFSELKFFPADLMGGPNWLKHVHPLYPDLRFCPTGGISDANVPRLPHTAELLRSGRRLSRYEGDDRGGAMVRDRPARQDFSADCARATVTLGDRRGV